MLLQNRLVTDQDDVQITPFESQKCAAYQFLWSKVATHGIQGDLHGEPLNFGIDDVYSLFIVFTAAAAEFVRRFRLTAILAD